MVDWTTLLSGISRGKTAVECGDQHTIFMQGESAGSLYFLLRGKVQLGVASQAGKEAIVATLGAGEFFGEGCLAGQPSRMFTAISSGACALIKVDKPAMTRALHDEPALAEVFTAHLLSRIIRYEADLVDQLFNSSEKRLAACSCCCPISAPTARPRRSWPESIRSTWPRWSARPVRGSITS